MDNKSITVKKKNPKKIIFIFIYFIFLFILQEILFRTFFPLPQVSSFNRANYMATNEIGGHSRENYIRNIKVGVISSLDSPETFFHSLNSYGFRGKDWKIEKKKGVKRFFFIGDSITEGNMSSDDQTIVKGFENRANEHGMEIEAINLGVSGGNWKSYIQLIVDSVPIFNPDTIFLNIFANDSPQSQKVQFTDPGYYDTISPRLFSLVQMIGSGEPLPYRWSHRKTYFAWNDKVNKRKLPNDSFLTDNVDEVVAQAIKERLFNPGLINWPLRAKYFLKYPYECNDQLIFLKNFLHKHNVKFHLIYIPLKSQVTNYYYQFEKKMCKKCPNNLDLTRDEYQIQRYYLKKIAAKLNIPFYDTTNFLKKEEERENHLYWNYDIHMNGEGYFLTGKQLFNWFVNYDN